MDYRSIIFKVENRVATATINRPEAANTINVDAKDELLSIIKEVSRNDDIGVLVLTGAGRIFCAGGDFRPSKVRKGEVSGETAEDMQPAYDEVRKGKILPDVIELSMALQRLEKPTIAMINGPVIGHGFDVALCCDVRTGSPASRFTVGFTNMGLPPVAGGVWLLPRIVGLGRALELILRGGWFSAEEAYRIGLLNHLFPADQLEKETMALAAEIAAGPPIAQRLAKQLIYKSQLVDFETSLAFATSCAFIASESQDFKEGVQALAEKRAPKFKGR